VDAVDDRDLVAQFQQLRADVAAEPFAHEDNAAAALAVWDRQRAS